MLEALTPLDGRYADKTTELRPFLSEAAFTSYRLHVEIQWLLHLIAWQDKGLKFNVQFSAEQKRTLEKLAHEVLQDPSFAQKAKDFERQTNHDVKAIEYTLAAHLRSLKWGEEVISLIHFACTSEDINNLAYALMLENALKKIILPHFNKIQSSLVFAAKNYKDIHMLSRTHGQKATPTTLGKEFAVFAHRLTRKLHNLSELKQFGKINGATGNYCAHQFVFPKVEWEELCKEFVSKKLGLEFNPLTTQIEPHDTVAELCHEIAHLSAILIDLCRDMWGYISFGYLKQKVKENEVGSSTMPHKVNPIDFENAEGNFGIAIALAQHLAVKLPISRFQRDLSDSTVLRSLGTLFGYLLVGLLALERGLGKIEADKDLIAKDLNESWELLGEALQTALRACGVSNAYERMKKATRGQALTQKDYLALVEDSHELNEDLRKRLLSLRPQDYVGLASELVQRHFHK